MAGHCVVGWLFAKQNWQKSAQSIDVADNGGSTVEERILAAWAMSAWLWEGTERTTHFCQTIYYMKMS